MDRGSRGVACPGGIPFSNSPEDIERNTVTNAPTAELGLQLYRPDRQRPVPAAFAEMAYEWVRGLPDRADGLYADHIGLRGKIEPEEVELQPGRR